MDGTMVRTWLVTRNNQSTWTCTWKYYCYDQGDLTLGGKAEGRVDAGNACTATGRPKRGYHMLRQ